MNMKITNLTHGGNEYRGRIREISYDAVSNEFTGEAVWRSAGTFQKGAVSALTIPLLAVQAIQLITGP